MEDAGQPDTGFEPGHASSEEKRLRASVPTGTGGICNDAGISREFKSIQDAVKQKVPCFMGYIYFGKGKEPRATAGAGFSTGEYLLAPCVYDATPLKDMATAAQDAIASKEVPCVEKQASPNVSVKGGAGDDVYAMYKVLAKECSAPILIKIAVDSEGYIRNVTSRVPESERTASDSEDIACATEALQGQAFHCLAGLELCAEELSD